MIGRIVAALVVGLLVGCGSTERTAAPVPGGQDAAAVPPAEMRMILEGLRSPRAGTQYGALQTLGRFPSAVQTHREHVERLQREGKTQQVRQKAGELLAALER